MEMGLNRPVWGFILLLLTEGASSRHAAGPGPYFPVGVRQLFVMAGGHAHIVTPLQVASGPHRAGLPWPLSEEP